MKVSQKVDYRIFDKLINKNIPFALYKRPEDEVIHFILQNDNHLNLLNEIDSLGSQNGFIISPFISSDSTPTVFIRPDVYIKDIEKINEYIIQILPGLEATHIEGREENEIPDENSFEFYKHNFETFHAALEKGEFEKLVLSRSVEYSKDKTFSLGETFERAIEKYSNAFVYICHTSLTGTWFGCSPEPLLLGKDGIWNTAALAGTKPIGEDSNDWDEKNKDEQYVVVKYIEQQLKALNIEFAETQPTPLQAGNIVHLKTNFSFKFNSQDEIGTLLKMLHPTPAVCGYPKEKALRFISENETYDRRYYAGFIGPVNMDGSTDLYVNLRCMEILEKSLRLYAGGGLLTTSDMVNEWLETEYKLQTILSIINTEND